MSTISRTPPRDPPVELHTGDRMTREEFHRLYEQTDEDFKAELIGGTVYVSSPLRIRHSDEHIQLAGPLWFYQINTPGVQAGDNGTLLLGEDSEPQPDLYLRILPEYGGQSTNRKDYVAGAPEFIAEIAHSSRAIDLHAKRDDYARYGVLEYLVFLVAERQLRWFDLRSDKELQPDAQGVIRIHCFPGLWIDAEALLGRDYTRLMRVLQQGIDGSEHSAFVTKLAGQKRSSQ